MPLSFCFFTTARAVFDSVIAWCAASITSGGAYPSGASSRYVLYRMEGPAFSSSQVSGIRCSAGSSRNAPGGEGIGRAAEKIVEDGKRRKVKRRKVKPPQLPPFRLASPASLNSELRFQVGWSGAFPTATAVLKMTRSCCNAPSYVNHGNTSSDGWW
jgi:hypothetical protein